RTTTQTKPTINLTTHQFTVGNNIVTTYGPPSLLSATSGITTPTAAPIRKCKPSILAPISSTNTGPRNTGNTPSKPAPAQRPSDQVHEPQRAHSQEHDTPQSPPPQKPNTPSRSSENNRVVDSNSTSSGDRGEGSSEHPTPAPPQIRTTVFNHTHW